MGNNIKLKDVETFVEDNKRIEAEIIKELESYGFTYDPTLEVGELTACSFWLDEGICKIHSVFHAKDKKPLLTRIKENFISQFSIDIIKKTTYCEEKAKCARANIEFNKVFPFNIQIEEFTGKYSIEQQEYKVDLRFKYKV